MKTTFYNLIMCVLLLSTLSCNKPSVSESCPIKSAEKIGEVKADLVKQGYAYFLKNVGNMNSEAIEKELAKVKYDIVFEKVTYEAVDPFGEKRILSGLVAYPVLPDNEKDKKISIVSVQHGTLSFEEHAPSNFSLKDKSSLNDVLKAIPPALEKGYIVVMPDYFGYGADEKNMHYYEVGSSLAEASRKLIEAIPSYMKEKSLNVNTSKLYLSGYSEGGFTTMWTLKSFSEKSSMFESYVTVAGAGAYDKVATAKDVTQQSEDVSPTFTASYLWVMLSYNKVYDINRPLNELLQPDMVSIVDKYVGNDKIMQEKNIPATPSKAFSKPFIEGIGNESDKQFMEALKMNDASDFDAKGSLLLIHGSKDTWVPTLNTDSAYTRLKKKGVNVEKLIYENGNHSSTYGIFTVKVLESLK